MPHSHPYPYLAQLGGHHERRHAVVVEHRFQAAVRVEFGALDEQQVIHLGEEARVVLGVVGDVHQRVQHRVATRVLPPHVGLLVRVLSQVVHDVWLVGAGSQREGELTWVEAEQRGNPSLKAPGNNTLAFRLKTGSSAEGLIKNP